MHVYFNFFLTISKHRETTRTRGLAFFQRVISLSNQLDFLISKLESRESRMLTSSRLMCKAT